MQSVVFNYESKGSVGRAGIARQNIAKLTAHNKPFPVFQARRHLIGGQCPPYKTDIIKHLSPYIRLRHVPPHHPVGVEIVGVFAYGVLHHPYPDRPVVIISRDDLVLEFLIHVFRVKRVRRGDKR